MTRRIALDVRQRRTLLQRYRTDPQPEVRCRAHILLLLVDGHNWVSVWGLLFCSSRTVDRWVKRFQAEGLGGLAGHKPGRPFCFAAGWVAVVVGWVTTKANGLIAARKLHCGRIGLGRGVIRISEEQLTEFLLASQYNVAAPASLPRRRVKLRYLNLG